MGLISISHRKSTLFCQLKGWFLVCPLSLSIILLFLTANLHSYVTDE